ncbi:MAG: YggS family pyridoxal phosphate-dependent enzyme [Oscillospiraceae bacterium]|jgi:pyridoxal phosphate enzyme (YggS family)|nr:YggS family pyridoxal phosphate-dependent enzyme [Oscillospiraceae bacterium]
MSDTTDNLKDIKRRAALAMERAGRTDEVYIMAVTKTVPFEKVNEAVRAGADLLGENRVQEFLEKRENYECGTPVHFIGRLQRNKIRQIVGLVDMIHSVDDFLTAEEISVRSEKIGITTDVLIEVNFAAEESKGGVPPDQTEEFIAEADKLHGIRVRGIMTIPPPGESETYFPQAKALFGKLKETHTGIDTLSMGMSDDWEQAIEHGATIIRIGSALFGKRSVNK